MLRYLLSLCLLLPGVLQAQCLYDVYESDPFNHHVTTGIFTKVSPGYFVRLYTTDTVRSLMLRVQLNGAWDAAVLPTDTARLMLDDGTVLKFNLDKPSSAVKNVSGTEFSVGTGTVYSPMYPVSRAVGQLLMDRSITLVRFVVEGKAIDAEVSPQRAKKIRKAAQCLYGH